jgi:hypothetical protein
MKKLLLLLSLIAIIFVSCKKETAEPVQLQVQNPPPPTGPNVVQITPYIEHFMLGTWQSCDPAMNTSYRTYSMAGGGIIIFDSLLTPPYTVTNDIYLYTLITDSVNKIKCTRMSITKYIMFELKPDSSMWFDGYNYCRK